MAKYQNGNELSHSVDPKFDVMHRPGSIAPYSGIYACTSCRDEIVANSGDLLPSADHRPHEGSERPVLWRLLIQTERGRADAVVDKRRSTTKQVRPKAMAFRGNP
ncbi:MAG: hypothetical protein AB7O56_09910 [Bauldia sp.]